MAGTKRLDRAKLAYRAAVKALEDAYELEFPPGTRVRYEHGDFEVRATVAMRMSGPVARCGKDTRVWVEGESGRTYWVHASRLRRDGGTR